MKPTAGCTWCRGRSEACDECHRLRAWGDLAEAVYAAWRLASDEVGENGLAALAFLMQERQALVHRHRREINEEAREAQRGARDSYSEGVERGRSEGSEW
jgi:hypothetical protein